MHSILSGLLSIVILAGCASSLQSSGKRVRLCWRLKKGDRFAVATTYREVSSRMDQYPLDLTLNTTIRYEIVEVSKDGAATLKGAIRKYSLKGRQPDSDDEVDVRWDASDSESRIEGRLNDPEKARAWLEAGIDAELDSRGHLTCRSSQIASTFLTPCFQRGFIGLLATYPADEVTLGDGWTEGLREGDLTSAVDYRVEMQDAQSLVVTTRYRSRPDDDQGVTRTGGAITRFDLKSGRPIMAKGLYTIPFLKTAEKFCVRGQIDSIVTKE